MCEDLGVYLRLASIPAPAMYFVSRDGSDMVTSSNSQVQFLHQIILSFRPLANDNLYAKWHAF